MWIAYAPNAEAARELASRLLADHVGPITWVAWPMEAVWLEQGTCAALRPGV